MTAPIYHFRLESICAQVPKPVIIGEGYLAARRNRLPFGITPHYLSLMDDEPAEGRDRTIRARVIPPLFSVEKVNEADRVGHCLDFMRESDTSPLNLITRRYPAIGIFKPFNTGPF